MHNQLFSMGTGKGMANVLVDYSIFVANVKIRIWENKKGNIVQLEVIG